MIGDKLNGEEKNLIKVFAIMTLIVVHILFVESLSIVTSFRRL